MGNIIMMMAGVVVFVIGIVAAGLGGINFYWRAITNKKAWEGIAKPALIIGVVAIVIGLIIIVMAGMQSGQFKF